MRNLIALLAFIVLLSSCTRSIYIVRHAEKATTNETGTMMGNDPPLTEKGKERAEALKEALKDKKIGYIFSTNTIRTRSTAAPAAAFFHLTTELYPPVPDDAFINRVKSLRKNMLIVGHSNTVDDLVNRLCGTVKIPGDLDESIYDNLFIVKIKGKKISFEQKKYGAPSP